MRSVCRITACAALIVLMMLGRADAPRRGIKATRTTASFTRERANASVSCRRNPARFAGGRVPRNWAEA